MRGINQLGTFLIYVFLKVSISDPILFKMVDIKLIEPNRLFIHVKGLLKTTKLSLSVIICG